MGNCDIRVFPVGLCAAFHHVKFIVGGNPLVFPPPSALSHNDDIIRPDFLRDCHKYGVVSMSLKVLVVGKAGHGKSQLVERAVRLVHSFLPRGQLRLFCAARQRVQLCF